MAVKTLDTKMECPKCGFRPNYQKDWNLEYKDKCNTYGYNACKWEDEVDEHLHQECPTCGYTIPVACEDHESKQPWTTTGDAPAATTTPASNVTAITSRPATVYTPPAKVKPAKCCKCPVDEKESAEA